MTSFRTEVIGDATLILGDCREVLPTLPRVDAVVTDPPYGIGLERKTSDFRGSRWFDNGASLQATKLYDDEPEAVRNLVRGFMPYVLLSFAPRALVFPGPAMMRDYPEPSAIGSVFTPNGAGRCAWGFQCSHPVLFYGKDPFLQDGRGGRPNSFRDEQPAEGGTDHPCPKPLRWMAWAVGRATREGELVCDPFMGSGTTGVACIKLGRKFIGIEIEPKYFDIACRRIEEAWKQPRLFEEPKPKPQQTALIFEEDGA